MLVQIFAVVRHAKATRRRFNSQSMRETEIAKLVMVSVALAIGGDVD